MTTRIPLVRHASLRWLVLLATLLLPLLSRADGGFLWKKDADLREPAQKAIILYDQGIEEMLLQVRYEGPADQFGWIIPVPGEPTVEPATMRPFYELSRLCQARQHALDGAGGVGTVDVLWVKTVGAYDTTLIKAGDAAALEAWLNRNGFHWPAGKQAVLDSYIQRKWYFIAVRVNLQAAGPNAEALLWTGELPPLKIRFASPQCVYPLKISSINVGQAEVLLYLIGRQPLVNRSLDFFTLNDKLRRFTPDRKSACVKELPRLLEGEWRLLEYRESFTPAEMEDLVFQPEDETQWQSLKTEYARRYCREERIRHDLAYLGALGMRPNRGSDPALTPTLREAAWREYGRVDARLRAVEALAPEEVGDLAVTLAAEGWPSFLVYTLHYERSVQPMDALATVLVQRMLAEKDDRLRGHYRVALSKISRKTSVVVEPLLAALPEANSSLQKDILFALGDTGDPRAFEPIAKAAQQDDPPISMFITLGKLDDPRGVPILHEALKVPKQHDHAVYALTLMRSPAVIDELIALLADPRAAMAAKALGEIGDRRAIEPLIEHFPHGDYSARCDFAIALSRLNSPEAIPLLISLLGEAQNDINDEDIKALAAYGAAAVEPLVAAILNAGNNPVNHYIKTLSRIGAPAQPVVIAALQKTTDIKIRKSLFNVLQCVGDTDMAVPYLRQLVAANTDTEISRDCILTIYERTEKLPDALAETDPVIRFHAAVKLAPQRNPQAFPILVETLHNDDSTLRHWAVSTLGNYYHDERTVKALEPMLAEERLRQHVIERLGFCGAPAVPVLAPLLQHPDQQVRSAAIFALGHCRAAALPLLIPLLEQPDQDTRSAVINALGQTGQRQAAEALAPLLASNDATIRRRVVIALARLEDERAVLPLIDYLRADDSEMRRSAIGYLGRFKDSRAVEPLIACLNDPNQSIVINIIGTLGRLDDTQAVEPLIGKLNDTNNIRNAALQSLNYLTGQRFHEQQQWQEWWAENRME